MQGPSIKYVTLEGRGVRESVTVCDTGRGSRACDVTLINFFLSYIWNINLKWFLTFCCNRCSLFWQKGVRTKSPDKPSRQETPEESPDKSPRTQLRENLYRGLLSGFFVLGLLKIGGSEMCDVLLGGSRNVWQSVTRGVKIGKKIVWRTLWTAPQPSPQYFENYCYRMWGKVRTD